MHISVNPYRTGEHNSRKQFLLIDAAIKSRHAAAMLASVESTTESIKRMLEGVILREFYNDVTNSSEYTKL